MWNAIGDRGDHLAKVWAIGVLHAMRTVKMSDCFRFFAAPGEGRLECLNCYVGGSGQGCIARYMGLGTQYIPKPREYGQQYLQKEGTLDCSRRYYGVSVACIIIMSEVIDLFVVVGGCFHVSNGVEFFTRSQIDASGAQNGV